MTSNHQLNMLVFYVYFYLQIMFIFSLYAPPPQILQNMHQNSILNGYGKAEITKNIVKIFKFVFNTKFSLA